MSKMDNRDYKKNAKIRNKKLLAYALRLKGIFAISIILTILSSILELIGPYIISKILDDYLVEGIGAVNKVGFYKLVGLFFLSGLMISLVRYLMRVSFSSLSNRLSLYIRQDIFVHVLSLPVKFFDKYPTGKIVTRITNDTADIRQLFDLLFSQIFTTIVVILGLLIGLFVLDYRIGLLTLVSTPIAWLIFNDYIKKSSKYNRDMRRARSDLNANLAETIQTMEIVHAFNKEEEIYNEFSKVNDEINAHGIKIAKLWAYSSFNATNTLSNLMVGGMVIIFGLSVIIDRPIMTIGGLFIFIDYSRRIYQNINSVMDMLGELEKSKSAADQVFELFDEEAYVEGSKKLAKLNGDIEFKNLSFAYKDNDYVLNNINLKINSGESAAFVGHTGSGKSTIMNLIYGFYKISKGELLIDGNKLEDLDMVDVRKQMAIVFQNPYIFEGSVYDNISLFDKNIGKEACEQALRRVGGDKILNRKYGIDSYVGEGGSSYSIGERQLISFARAMVRNPKILVLDEATANVDSETEDYIQYGVKQLKEGRTTLIIAHRLSTIKDSDKIFVLDKGNIIEEGSHKELISQMGQYEKMYSQS